MSWISSSSRWASITLAVACIAIGLAIAFKPFASLAVLIIAVALGAILLGIEDWGSAPRAPIPALSRTVAVLWFALALAVLAWPGATIRTVAVLVGIGMVVSGSGRVVSGLRGGTDERLAAVVLGVASVIFGALALAWPDITVLIVALFFGVRLILSGVARLIAVVRGERAPDAPSGRGGRVGRWSRAVAAIAALALAVASLGISSLLHRGEPSVDAFYDPPAEVPAEPGVLLAVEPFTRAVPEGAEAWRILYTTTRDEGSPTIASAIVLAAADRPDEPRPVVAWAHGTTGFARECAPSLLKDPFSAGAMPGMTEVIANGWVLVATDYIGLGTEGPHAYLVGQPAGRAVLDSVRAAKGLDMLTLGDRTVVWGHSQGGHAALWTGILAPDYAPDVNVVGVAALAPASNLSGLVGNLDTVTGGSLFGSFVIAGYSETYDDVAFGDYVRPAARVIMREMADRCLAEPAVFTSIVESLLFDRSPWSRDLTTGALGQRMEENIPRAPIAAPVLLGQGLTDELVLPAAQDAYVAAQCDAGTSIEYRSYADRDHVQVVAADSPLVPDLVAWTQARFDGAPAASTCGT